MNNWTEIIIALYLIIGIFYGRRAFYHPGAVEMRESLDHNTRFAVFIIFIGVYAFFWLPEILYVAYRRITREEEE